VDGCRTFCRVRSSGQNTEEHGDTGTTTGDSKDDVMIDPNRKPSAASSKEAEPVASMESRTLETRSL